MPQSIKLTNRQLIALERGLQNTTGLFVSKTEILPYDFDTKVVYAMARDIIAVTSAIEAYNKAFRTIVRAAGYADNERLEINSETSKKVAEYQDKIEALKDLEITLDGILLCDLSKVQMKPPGDDKKVKKNPIPPATIADLWPIIKDDTPAES
jgi:hypothetical protein